MKSKNPRIVKILSISTTPVFLVGTLLTTQISYNQNNTNVVLNGSLNDNPIDISTVITVTDMGEMNEKPSFNNILSFIYNSVSNDYKNIVNDLEIDGTIGDTQTIIKVKPYTTTYAGAVNMIYTIKSKKDIQSEIQIRNLGNVSAWQNTPTKAGFLTQLNLAQSNPNLNINQLTCDTNEVKYDNANNIYKLKVYPVNNSSTYIDSGDGVEVAFGLNQTSMMFRNLTVYYPSSGVTAPTGSDTTGILTINANGEYFIKADTYSGNRGIAISNNLNNVVLNVVGDTVNLNAPSGYAAITIGENSNLQFNVNANSTSFIGYDSKPGVRVPYTSSIIISGSTMLTVFGGGTNTACAIGGAAVSPGTSKTTGDAACGTVIFKGNISANLTSGANTTDHQINGSAVIGGGGTTYNYAGSAKHIEFDTTGTIVCTKPNGKSWEYGRGPIIGGGGVGNVTGQYGYGGDLEEFVMKSGTLEMVAGNTAKAIPNPTYLGGGTVTVDQTNSKTSVAGNLNNFTMIGGKIVINCPSDFAEYGQGSGGPDQQRSPWETTIGGGDILLTRGSSDNVVTLGSLNNFTMSGGNIVMYGSYSDREYGNVIGPGTVACGTLSNTINQGTTGTFNITGGSMLMTNGQTSTYHFSKVPTNTNNQNLYPVYIPKTIGTIGETVTIPSLNYIAKLDDYSAYSGFSTYTGVIWLPVGNYTDIQIGPNTYQCNVIASLIAAQNVVN